MAHSLKNTLASLALSGALLFTGFLAGGVPVAQEAPAIKIADTQAAKPPAAIKAKIENAASKRPHAFAAPYFSFGKSGITRGARQ